MSSRTMSGRISSALRRASSPPAARDHAEALVVEGDRHELGDPRLVVGDEDERLRAHATSGVAGSLTGRRDSAAQIVAGIGRTR